MFVNGVDPIALGEECRALGWRSSSLDVDAGHAFGLAGEQDANKNRFILPQIEYAHLEMAGQAVDGCAGHLQKPAHALSRASIPFHSITRAVGREGAATGFGHEDRLEDGTQPQLVPAKRTAARFWTRSRREIII